MGKQLATQSMVMSIILIPLLVISIMAISIMAVLSSEEDMKFINFPFFIALLINYKYCKRFLSFYQNLT